MLAKLVHAFSWKGSLAPTEVSIVVAARLTEAIFPPRLDWIANYRLTYVSVIVDLTLAPRVYQMYKYKNNYKLVQSVTSLVEPASYTSEAIVDHLLTF